MFARLVGCAMFGMVLCACAIEAGGAKVKTTVEKKTAVGSSHEGTIKSVDFKKGTFVLIMKGKSENTFQVTPDTKFIGPKGGNRGKGMDGLKDDCMAPGYVVSVIVPKTTPLTVSNAIEVHLPNRKGKTTIEKKTTPEKK